MAVKVFFYTLRPYDEQGILEDLAKQRGIEYGYTEAYPTMENAQLAALEGKAKFGFWEKFDDSHTVVRIATSWATKMEEIEQLIALM